uniref:PPFIA binding protein 2 n=1 Tax=Dromaius novaehollandiae TaxID=8790 RepID=A0A8C4JTG1_DRONO
MASDASHMLEAALEQMDDIIAGTKSATEYANGGYDIVSPAPSVYLGTLQILHLLEDLKIALEMLEDPQEKEALRSQIPGATAMCIREWFEENLSQVNLHSSMNNETYQERLARLEGDKESLILQVSVLTDQVEAQGEKIRDLEICLEGHQLKLNATEEMLQQELLSRTSLETQKLDLMAEVSDLKIKLVGMEKEQSEYEEKQNKAESVVNLISELQEQMCRLQLEINNRIQERKSQDRKPDLTPNEGKFKRQLSILLPLQSLLQELRHLKIKVEELENERNQYEWKLKATKAEIAQLQEQLALKDAEIERLQSQLSRMSTHNEVAEKGRRREIKDRRIEELTLLLSQYRRVKEIMLAAHGETETMDGTVVSEDLSPLSSGTDSGPQSPLSPENRKSPKGIKKIWGKIRRTQSGNFPADDLGLAEFRRGGLRATAGPRLSRSKETKGQKSDYNAPFAQWGTERVCNWLEDFGLGQYVIFARQWVSSGHTLLTATPQDMEKEMGIKHPLHRKKLVLAIKSINAKQDEKSAQLDHIWVTRWLDDIGLPQYKDQFHESRVDGRMLQYLTVNDLLFLKVTSQLHHLSIKCAIHVLHVNSFNPHCLRRRPVDENNVSPSEVVQWSNHRVMEWLRSVDLAEYAPNLRGSGVHGGLIILEPRFNGDTLAMLLNIPPQKTLLRRHLTTNFNVLIGPEAQQEKREIMESTAYTPLTTTAKVRPKKLGFSHFGNLRKKKFDESTDYICPMDTNPGATNGTQKNYGGYKGLSPFTDRELDKLDQMEHSEGTVMQIGALSQGINNLTVCTNSLLF